MNILPITYEELISNNTNHIFVYYGCKFLENFGKFKRGKIYKAILVDYIKGEIAYFGPNKGDMIIEHFVICKK